MNYMGAPSPSHSGDVSDTRLLRKELEIPTSKKVSVSRRVWFSSVIRQTNICRRSSVTVLFLFLMVTSSTIIPVDSRQDRKTLSPSRFSNDSLGPYNSQRWVLKKRRDSSMKMIQEEIDLHNPNTMKQRNTLLNPGDGIIRPSTIPTTYSSRPLSRNQQSSFKSSFGFLSFVNRSSNFTLIPSSAMNTVVSQSFVLISCNRSLRDDRTKYVICYRTDKLENYPFYCCSICGLRLNSSNYLDFIAFDKKDLIDLQAFECHCKGSVEKVLMPLLRKSYHFLNKSLSENKCKCHPLLNKIFLRQLEAKCKRMIYCPSRGLKCHFSSKLNSKNVSDTKEGQHFSKYDRSIEVKTLSGQLKTVHSSTKMEALKADGHIRRKRSAVDGRKPFARKNKRYKKNISLSGHENRKERYGSVYGQKGQTHEKPKRRMLFLNGRTLRKTFSAMKYVPGRRSNYSPKSNTLGGYKREVNGNCSKTWNPELKFLPTSDEKEPKRIWKRENGRWAWRELSSEYRHTSQKRRFLSCISSEKRNPTTSYLLDVIPETLLTKRRSDKGRERIKKKKAQPLYSSVEISHNWAASNSSDKTNPPTTSQKQPSNSLPSSRRFRSKKTRRKIRANNNQRQQKIGDTFDGNIASESLNEAKSFRDSVGYSGASESSKGIDEALETNFLNTRKSEEDAETFPGDERSGKKNLALPKGHQKMMGRRRKRKIDISSVSVIEGEEAALPCDLRSADPDDTVQIILWIKEGLHTPLYSYDFREAMRGNPKETKPHSNSTMSRRTSFRTDRTPAALIIRKAEMDDAGIYRCRVDFRHSPTLNYRVNLTVVVSPTTLRIGWFSNHSSVSTANREVGPFKERSQPTIICASDDGYPPPSVMWYENDKLLDDSYYVDYNQGVVENEMKLPPLTREDLGRNLTCVASNSETADSANRSVLINMTLRIIGVKLLNLGTIWAEEKTRAVCQIWGSRPKPNVLWWLGSQMFSPAETKMSKEDANITLSYLNIVPSSSDDGAMLICQATNELLPDQAVQDSTILSVNYAPQVSVHLGHSLDPEKIKEGDDVYFECTVKSKPPVNNVIWKHNGVKLVAGSGIILSNMSLVVQGVTRSHGGNYTCHASNLRKTSASVPLHLDVKYTPFCASAQRQQHSVGKLENAEIACKVDANPRNVSFRWTFNNTAEAIDVPEGRFVVVGTESRVNYTPMNELDYGTLLCWANNSIGMQQYPCVFHIVAAGKPDPPHNCRVFDVTISSFQVHCLPGDDGGLEQEFVLHLYKVGALSPIAEFSERVPTFTINNLQPATSYRIVLASVNEKGTSRLIERNAYTIKVLEKLEETSAEPARDRVRGKGVPLEIILGIIGAVVSLVSASVVLVWFRVCRNASSEEEDADGSGGSVSEASSKCQVKDTATTETAVSEATPQMTRHHEIQQSIDPAWTGEGALIATISAPPYLVAGGDKQYPVAAGSSAPSSEVGGVQYSQFPEQGGYYSYSQRSTEIQLQTPVRKLHSVPYYTNSAQLQQVQEPSSMGASSLEYSPCVLQFPPPVGQHEQQETYLESSQKGELLHPSKSLATEGGQDQSDVFPPLLHILPGSLSKPHQSSHCSVHHCPNEAMSLLEGASVPGVSRKGSLKILSQYRNRPLEPVPASIPSFQSMEDVSKSQRQYPVPVDQYTASLSRTKHFKRDPSTEVADPKSCQHLTNTIPRSQRKNKMESAV